MLAAGRLVGPSGEELVPLLARQCAVGEVAGPQLPGLWVDVPDGPLAVAVNLQHLAAVGGEIDHRPAVPRGELRADLGSARNVPERRDRLEAGDCESPAIRAELESERSVAALVELVDELPGADVPEAYDPAEAADRQEVPVGAERDGGVKVSEVPSNVAIDVPVAASQTTAPPSQGRTRSSHRQR